jgi:hypothetical protein
MRCPKCGFEQNEGPECLRCGIVFSRIRISPQMNAPVLAPELSYSLFRHLMTVLLRFYRIFRWISLAGLIVVLILILHNSPPPEIVVSREAAQSAETKIQHFQSSVSHGSGDTLEFNQSELNGWLDANLAINGKQENPPSAMLQTKDVASLARKALNASDIKDSDLERVQSSIKDLKINLMEDSLRLYMVFESHGIDLSLELEGRPLVRDGYLRFDPTSGRLGSLPLLRGSLQKLTDSLFDSPQNRDKFRLPLYIRDMRIENGQLVVVSS